MRGTAVFAAALLCGMSPGCAANPRAQAGGGPDAGITELSLARPPTARETVALELRVGVLPSGSRVRVSTEDGDVIGVVAPFGRLAPGGVSAHVMPLPARLIREGRVRIRITLDVPGAPGRAPGQAEVEKVSLIFIPTGTE